MLPLPLTQQVLQAFVRNGQFPSMLGFYAALVNGTAPGDDSIGFTQGDFGPSTQGLGLAANQVQRLQRISAPCHAFSHSREVKRSGVRAPVLVIHFGCSQCMPERWAPRDT